MTTYQQLCRKPARRGESPRTNRAGSVTLEFILALPVLLIVLLAVIELGMFFSNMQQVALASRVGAEAASQTDLSGTDDGDPVPPDIVLAINRHLAVAGITDYSVVLQHNVQGATQTLNSTVGNGGPCNAATVLPGIILARSVGVTICVPMTKLAPNCLALCGFDLTGRCAKCGTTFRYELSTP